MAELYLDACCFICLVEGKPSWQNAVQRRLGMLPAGARILTSQLSRLECRSGPMRDNNGEVLARYDALFGAGRITVLDLDAPTVDRPHCSAPRSTSRRPMPFT